MLPKIVAVIGPTASGKTDLGAYLARRFGGEIVSADAKQVYRGMDIGTAKETGLDVPQHLLDLLDPGEKVTVGWYQERAYEAIDRLLAEGKLPILVGGSGLYAESVLKGYLFGGKGSQPRYESLKLGIALEREALKERATLRLRARIDAGLVDEVRGLLERGVDPEWLWNCGIEYRYFSGYLRGLFTLEEATQKAATATCQFIKRQYTWWRRHDDVRWVETPEEAEALAGEFLTLGKELP
jgi:tRNA dimethylallyltransferase